MFFDELPDEITLRILQLLPTAKDLVAVKRVSREEKRLSMDESAWLEQLKNDFYFTNETAKANRSRLFHKTHAEFYQYCVNYQLNDYEKSIVDAFQANGLKPEHLKGRNFHAKYLDYVDQNFQSLRYLMREREPAMSAKDAIAEIDGLSDWQLRGINESLSRAVVIDMNELQISTLLMLKPKGLRAEHLKEEGINWDDWRFHIALKYLMTKQDSEMDAKSAIATLKWLAPWQAHGISEGLSLIEVSKLNNFNQVEALIKLKPHGLQAEHFAGEHWFTYDNHRFGLDYLMTKHNPVMSAEAAMAKLRGFPLIEANKISKGLAREEIETQSWSSEYRDALDYLTLRRDPPMDIKEAEAELEGLSGWQLAGISKGLLLKHVIVLSPPQENALSKLKRLGLRAKHLNDKVWFSSYEHLDALDYLMSKRNPVMNAEAAMAELEGLSLKQAIMISYGLSREEVLKEAAEPVDQARPTLKPF